MNTPKLVNDVAIIQRTGNAELASFALAAAAATSTIEVFEGEIGVVDATGDVSVSDGGTGYEVGDLLTITPTNGGTPAVYEVATLTVTAVATVTLVTAGSGFVSGGTYETTTDGAGTDATLDTDTVDNTLATSLGKISCVANTSEVQHLCTLAKDGISALVTGASAKGYLYYK